MAILDLLILRARFEAQKPSGVQVFYDNQPNSQPTLGQPYIRFAIRTGATKRESFGSGIETMQGRVWCQIFTPKQTGDGLALSLAGQCGAIFRNYDWQNGSKVIRCQVPEITQIDTDEKWYQVNVSTFFEAQDRY
ncbi:MAG: phage tail terminator-like protein [Sphingobium sp.]